MSIKRLSGAGLTTPKSNKLWDQTTFQSGMFAIATVSLTTSASEVTFDSIPLSYTHLQLRAVHRITTSATGSRRCILQINNDTTASNYRNHWLYGNGSSAASESDGANPIVAYSTDAANLTGAFSATIIDIPNYTGDKLKSVVSFNGQDINGSGGLVGLYSMANFNGTGAITRLTFKPNSGGDSLAAYSHFALYGIKAV